MSDAPESRVFALRITCPTPVLDDPAFRPAFLFEPAARHRAREEHGCTTRFAGRYEREPGDAPGSEIAVTYWELVPPRPA